MVAFYNQIDRDIYDSGIKFMPQEKYRLYPFSPAATENVKKIESTFGLPATSAFQNSKNPAPYTGSNSSLVSGFNQAITDRQNRLEELNRPLAEAQFPSFKGARTSDLDGDPYGLPNMKGFSANEMYNKAAAAKAAGLDTTEMFAGNMNADQAMDYADDRIQDHKMRYATGQLGPSYIPAEKPTLNRRINDAFYSLPGLSKPQSARDILESGYTGTGSGPGLMAAILGKFDRYSGLPRANQAFIASKMGYLGPTIFGANDSGLSKDPFGINTRSAFGDYAEYTTKRAGELNKSIQESKDRWTGKFGSLDAVDPKYGKTWAEMNKTRLEMQDFYNAEDKEFKELQDKEYQNRIDKFVTNYKRPGVKEMFETVYDGSNIHGGATTTTTTNTNTNKGGDGGGIDISGAGTVRSADNDFRGDSGPTTQQESDYGYGSDAGFFARGGLASIL